MEITTDLLELLEINNFDYEALYNLGVIQFELKKFNDAEASFFKLYFN